MSGILAQGARFHLLGMPRNYALTFHEIIPSWSGVYIHLLCYFTIRTILLHIIRVQCKKTLQIFLELGVIYFEKTSASI